MQYSYSVRRASKDIETWLWMTVNCFSLRYVCLSTSSRLCLFTCRRAFPEVTGPSAWPWTTTNTCVTPSRRGTQSRTHCETNWCGENTRSLWRNELISWRTTARWSRSNHWISANPMSSWKRKRLVVVASASCRLFLSLLNLLLRKHSVYWLGRFDRTSTWVRFHCPVRCDGWRCWGKLLKTTRFFPVQDSAMNGWGDGTGALSSAKKNDFWIRRFSLSVQWTSDWINRCLAVIFLVRTKSRCSAQNVLQETRCKD